MQWMSEEEGKQSKVKAHEEAVLESSTVSARLVQMRNAFEKLNKKKKPTPPPVTKSEVNATGELFFHNDFQLQQCEFACVLLRRCTKIAAGGTLGMLYDLNKACFSKHSCHLPQLTTHAVL